MTLKTKIDIPVVIDSYYNGRQNVRYLTSGISHYIGTKIKKGYGSWRKQRFVHVGHGRGFIFINKYNASLVLSGLGKVNIDNVDHVFNYGSDMSEHDYSHYRPVEMINEYPLYFLNK